MSEGTKLGEFKEDIEFNTAIQKNEEDQVELSATKLGELSEFEKSLGIEEKKKSEEPKVEKDVVEESSIEDKNTNQDESAEEQIENQAAKSVETKSSNDENSSENIFTDALKDLSVDYEEGDLVKGIVRSIEKGGILVDINYKSDGFISNSDLQDEGKGELKSIKVGD